MPADYLPVLLAFGVAIVAGVTLLGISYLLGPKTGGRAKKTTYESGMPLLDRSRKRLSIAFFLVAIDFVVFDVEAAFLYPWATVARDGGWTAFWAVMLFTALVVAGYAYVWKKGGLEIATRHPQEKGSSLP